MMKKLLLLVIFLLFPTTVSAQTILVNSSIANNAILDAPPPVVTLVFNQSLDQATSSLELYDERGIALGLERPTFPAANQIQVALPEIMRPSAYTLVYRVQKTASRQVVSGVLLFSIGTGVAPTGPSVAIQSTQPADPTLAILKTLQLLGGLLIVGTLIWLIVLVLPALRQQTNDGGSSLIQRTLQIIKWSLVTLIVATVLEFIVRINFDNLTLAEGIANSWGGLALVRLLLAFVVLQLVILIIHRKFMAEIALAVASLILLTFSFSGHALATVEPFTPIAMDWMHQIAAAAWFGGLVGFTSINWWLRGQTAEQRNPLLAWIIARFSPLALFSVALVGLTGVMRAFDHLPALSDLWQTNYGRVLLIKLIVLFGALLLGSWHWRRVNPRLQAAVSSAQQLKIGRTLLLESLLAIGVVLATGWLTQTPTPVANAQPALTTPINSTPRQPLTLTASQQDLTIALSIDDQRPGLRTFTASISDTNGLIAVERVMLRLSSLDLGSGEQVALMNQTADRTYTAQTNAINVLGNWQITLQIRRPNQPDVNATWTLELKR